MLKDLHCYGADTEASLKKRFGHFFTEAKEQKLLMPITTAEGECFFLNYKARKVLGLAPNHVPPPWVAQTHLYRRAVIKQLQAEGYELQGWFSKKLLGFKKDGRSVVVAAKHDGYTAKSIRRIRQQLRQSYIQHHLKLIVFTPYVNRLKALEAKHDDLEVIKHP